MGFRCMCDTDRYTLSQCFPRRCADWFTSVFEVPWFACDTVIQLWVEFDSHELLNYYTTSHMGNAHAHNSDVTRASCMASQITGGSAFNSRFSSGYQKKRKCQNSKLLTLRKGIHSRFPTQRASNAESDSMPRRLMQGITGTSLPSWYHLDWHDHYSPASRWRNNGRDGVSNHQPHDCFIDSLFGCRSKKTSKFCVTGLCAGKFTGDRWIPRTNGQ